MGQSAGFQPPDIKLQVEDFRGGGMDGTVEIPMGIEKMEFDFDLHTWDEDIWESFGYGPGSLDVKVAFYGYAVTPAGTEKGVKILTNSLIKDIKTNKVEPGKKVEMTISCAANKYEHYIDERLITQIDIFNRVTVINGNDRSANARRILGYTYFGSDGPISNRG
jgi:P2 family phage contractile tail tube protein